MDLPLWTEAECRSDLTLSRFVRRRAPGLLGMQIDIEEYLGSSGLLRDVVIEATSTPEGLLEVAAVAEPGITAGALEQELSHI